VKLREYQLAAADAIQREWVDKRSTLVVLPTGAGKTILAAEVTKRLLPGRTIFIAHRDELIFQARDKMMYAAQIDCEIEKAELVASTSLWNRSPCVVASVQTLVSGKNGHKRMQRFKPDDFACLIIDECFPAGTLVDGRPIEEIRVGDYVSSVTGRAIQNRTVTRIFKKKCRRLITVHFKDGSILRCTPEHPVWSETHRAFVPAIMLDTNDVVLRLTTEYDYEFRNTSFETLSSMRGARPIRESQSQIVFSRVQKAAKRGSYGRYEQEARVGTHEEKQSHGPKGESGKDVSHSPGHRPQAGYPGWEWKGANGTGDEAGERVGMVDRICRKHWHAGPGDSDSLQNRRGQPEYEGRTGSGRFQPLRCRKTITRPQEGAIPCFVGVDYIEVHEQTSDGTFGGLCPDGHVYNLEVKQSGTYFANGLLVHNCHHGAAKTYVDIIRYFSQNPNLRILGITATPDRSDEQALGQVFDSVAFDYEILDAIHDGWLVPVQQQIVSTTIDWSGIRTTAGDLNGADLNAVMEAEEAVQGVAGATIKIVGDRRTLIFVASVKQAEMVCDIINRPGNKPGSAEWVCGATPRDQRRELLGRFERGQTQIVVNCDVLGEGYDNPAVQCIVIARPTKSRSKYAQFCGRGLRPLYGIVDNYPTAGGRKLAIAMSAKPNCTIIDFAGVSGRHKLMTTADILGGNVSDEAVDKAKELAKKADGPVNMQKLLDEEEKKLREQAEKRRLAESARKAKVVAKVSYTTSEINPFDAFDLTPAKDRGWDNNRTLSEAQRLLMRNKMNLNPDDYTYAQARQLLNEQFKRWRGGLASLNQLRRLKEVCPELKATELTRKEASALLARPSIVQRFTPSEELPFELCSPK
jgi:superfamily II DNA or RNA helicase